MRHLIYRRSLLAFACLSLGILVSSPSRAGAGADLILTNGHVYTADPKARWAEAVAVKGGKIVYVGSNAGAKAKRGKNTKETDLGGRLLLPGFFDTHNHVSDRAIELFQAKLGSPFSTHTLESYGQSLLEFRASHPGAKQVHGYGFDGWILPAIAQSRKRQPRQLLDDIVSDIPVAIDSWTGHQTWANTKAIELAGINKDTPNPVGAKGAQIDRDPATGEPNGIFRENAAQNLIRYKLPEPDLSVEQYRTVILSWQQEVAAQRGLTGALSPTWERIPNFFTAMQQLSDEGKLTAHYSVAQWQDDLRGVEQLPELLATRARIHGGRYFRFNTIKIFAPWPQDKLNETVAALDKEHFQIFVHNTGPTASYAAVLDAFEYALKQNGSRDARHIITHNRAASAPLVARFKSLGVRGDADWNLATDWYRAPKAFIETGVPLTLSSDYPIRDPSPLSRIAECAKHGISREALIDSVTIRGAEAQFIEKQTGSITVGKAADLIVMDRDLFKIAAEEIERAKVLLTVFAGEELYRDPSL